MTTRRVLLTFGAAAAIGFLAGCSTRPRAEQVNAAAPIPVTIATVAMMDVPDTFDAGGIVRARTSATLTSRIVAPVREVKVAAGDRVRAGQVLIVLDGRDLTATARSASEGVLAAEQSANAAAADGQAADAELVLAQTTYDRIAALHGKRSATAQELDNATAALRSAEARVASAAARARAAGSHRDSARAAGDAAGTTASFAMITAPFDGTVTEKTVEAGNMAAPGVPLLRVEDTRAFRLEVRVDESRMAQVIIGRPVPVVLGEDTAAATTVQGTVAEIERTIDPEGRSFLVKIALPGTTTVRSGAFGRARFVIKARRNLIVPESALVRRGQLTSAFVVEDGVARLRLVNASGPEVLAGLGEGDVVIVGPPPGLVDGRRVTPGGRP